MSRGIFLCCIILVVTLAVVSKPATASSWQALPIEIVVDESEVICVGTVSATRPMKIGKQEFDAATVRVRDVLKGSLDKRTVEIIGQKIGGADMVFQTGRSWVFLLQRDGERFRLDSPDRLRQLTEFQQITRLIEKRAHAHGEVQKGISARLERIHPKQSYKPYSQQTDRFAFVWFSIYNQSKNPVTLVHRTKERPLSLRIQSESGDSRDALLYQLLEQNGRTGSAEFEIQIPSGGIRYIGPIARYQPIILQSQAAKLKAVERLESGPNKVWASYDLRLAKPSKQDDVISLKSNAIQIRFSE